MMIKFQMNKVLIDCGIIDQGLSSTVMVTVFISTSIDCRSDYCARSSWIEFVDSRTRMMVTRSSE